jgi:hypothetical protein
MKLTKLAVCASLLLGALSVCNVSYADTFVRLTPSHPSVSEPLAPSMYGWDIQIQSGDAVSLTWVDANPSEPCGSIPGQPPSQPFPGGNTMLLNTSQEVLLNQDCQNGALQIQYDPQSSPAAGFSAVKMCMNGFCDESAKAPHH